LKILGREEKECLLAFEDRTTDRASELIELEGRIKLCGRPEIVDRFFDSVPTMPSPDALPEFTI
jgi:hypothetical protein